MTSPQNIVITPKDTWQKVATNIRTGRIELEISTLPNHYLYTYVDTGSSAPTGTLIGIRMDEPLEINSSVGIDVYIMAIGDVGEIQVQL